MKGQIVRERIVEIIIVIAIFMILLAATVFFVDVFKGVGEIEQCRLQVVKASTGGKIGPLPIEYKKAKCPFTPLELDLSDDKEDAERELASILVQEMEDCWIKFGKGKLAPFRGEKVLQKTHCYICTSFSAPQDLRMQPALDTQLSLDEKADALLENAIPIFAGGKRRLYYATKIIVLDDALDTELGLINLEKDQEYYLLNVFIVNREISFWTAGFLNSQDTESQLVFTASDNIHNICAVLEN